MLKGAAFWPEQPDPLMKEWNKIKKLKKKNSNPAFGSRYFQGLILKNDFTIPKAMAEIFLKLTRKGLISILHLEWVDNQKFRVWYSPTYFSCYRGFLLTDVSSSITKKGKVMRMQKLTNGENLSFAGKLNKFKRTDIHMRQMIQRVNKQRQQTAAGQDSLRWNY